MPRYQYACPACGEAFDAFRSVAERERASCPSCGGMAGKLFQPGAIAIQTPAHLQLTRQFYQPLSTAQHTSDYLEQQVLEQHLERCYLAEERAAQVPSFDAFFKQQNPDLDLNQPLTAAESGAVKAALGALPS